MWFLKRRGDATRRTRRARLETAVAAQSVRAEAPGEIPFTGHVGVSITRPRRLTPRTGILLLIHGLGSDWDEHDRLAEDWSDLFDCLCVQVRDRHAGGRGMQAPMDLGKYQTIDCLRAIQWVMENHKVDAARIVVWGGSGGGHLALQCGWFAPQLFSGVISCAPFTHPTLPGDIGREWIDGWIRHCIPSGPVPEPEREIRSPLGQVGRLASPVLLMHGDEDTVVNCEHSRRLAKAAKEARVPLHYHEIAGADHDFTGGEDGLTSRRAATERLGADLMRTRRTQPGKLGSGKLTDDWQLQVNSESGLAELVSTALRNAHE